MCDARNITTEHDSLLRIRDAKSGADVAAQVMQEQYKKTWALITMDGIKITKVVCPL